MEAADLSFEQILNIGKYIIGGILGVIPVASGILSLIEIVTERVYGVLVRIVPNHKQPFRVNDDLVITGYKLTITNRTAQALSVLDSYVLVYDSQYLKRLWQRYRKPKTAFKLYLHETPETIPSKSNEITPIDVPSLAEELINRKIDATKVKLKIQLINQMGRKFDSKGYFTVPNHKLTNPKYMVLGLDHN